jgi:hypothetical protein
MTDARLLTPADADRSNLGWPSVTGTITPYILVVPARCSVLVPGTKNNTRKVS